MSLVVTDGDGEQNEMRMLQDKLASTMKVVTTLTTQLTELKEQASSASCGWKTSTEASPLRIPVTLARSWAESEQRLNCTSCFLQMTEQRKRRQRMGFADVQVGASAAMPPSAAGGNHQIYKS